MRLRRADECTNALRPTGGGAVGGQTDPNTRMRLRRGRIHECSGRRFGRRGAGRWGVARQLKLRATTTKAPAGAGLGATRLTRERAVAGAPAAHECGPTNACMPRGWLDCRGRCGGAAAPTPDPAPKIGSGESGPGLAAAGRGPGHHGYIMRLRRVAYVDGVGRLGRRWGMAWPGGLAGRSRLRQAGAPGSWMLIGRDLGAALVAWRSALLQTRLGAAESWGGLAGRRLLLRASRLRPG